MGDRQTYLTSKKFRLKSMKEQIDSIKSINIWVPAAKNGFLIWKIVTHIFLKFKKAPLDYWNIVQKIW